jgi:hypothetical protein
VSKSARPLHCSQGAGRGIPPGGRAGAPDHSSSRRGWADDHCVNALSLSTAAAVSEGAAQLIVDVHPDDFVERVLGGEAQAHRPRRV